MKSSLQFTNMQSSIMQSLVGIAACALVISGCADGTYLAHNAKGSVYLAEVADWSFEASHPVVIDQLTITKIVKGLYSNAGMSGSSRMSVGGSKPMRIFSDEDAEFLSPLLAQGLSKAKPEQLVGFRVSSSAGSGSEPTTGSMYVRKESIYLTIGMGTNKPTGFTPESAARTEPASAYAAGGALDAMTMIIDYHALAEAPMPPAMPITQATPMTPIAPMTAAPADAQAVSNSARQEAGQDEFLAQKLIDLKVAKEALVRKDSEISILRKETEWMKRELRDRAEEIQALRLTKVSGKPAPKNKTAQATKTR